MREPHPAGTANPKGYDVKLTIHHWHQYLRGAYPWDYSVSYSAARDAELAVAPGSGFSGLEAVLYDVAARQLS